ncbi:MAG: HlyD family efflux transporter periplasmic adaptor subunit [Draconibacterium sp.]|nr:HlyD family efflux transporter periplasmic adaptor subunit [Draconibacterium sp.]
MKKLSILLLFAVSFSLLISCGSRQPGDIQEIVVPKATVKITTLAKGNIEDRLTLNGKTVFLKKNQVVAPISGYITAINVKFGDTVHKGDVLFEVQTREKKALQQLGLASGKKDFDFGKITVQATTSGMVNQPITLGVGAYVVEGTPLCNLADNYDLLVLVNVPYEFHRLVNTGTRCQLFLPDNSQIEGSVFRVQPFINETSQTQEVLIKPKNNRQLPENMNLTASFLKSGSNETMLLLKKAILTNETQSKFWVMKIVQDSVAINVAVETGIKNDSLVEIVSPDLTVDDKIILEGGYGLPDSSLVNIVK